MSIEFEVISVGEPKQVVNDLFCGWVAEAVISKDGNLDNHYFTSCYKNEIDEYKVGYKWTEYKLGL